MQGSFYRRGCICWQKKCTCGAGKKKECTCGASKLKIKKCTCGAPWAFTIDVGTDPKTGERRQKSKSGFPTLAKAEEAAALIQVEVSGGTYIQDSNALFKDFAPHWLEVYAVTHNVKVSTIRVRKHEMNRLMEYFAFCQVRDITSKQYQDALIDLFNKGYGYNTLAGAHSTGRMIFQLAIKEKVIKRENDPTEFAKIPRKQPTVEELEQEQELPKYLEKDELALFLYIAERHGLDDDYPMFLLLAYTGIRDGELCALKEPDMLAEGVNITKTYYNPTSNITKYELLPPKTSRSKRFIQTDARVLAELKKLCAKNRKDKMRHRDIYHDKGFVFTNKKYPGYPIYIKHVENRMRRLLKLAGLDTNLTPHSLRHTHTSLLAEAGASLEEIMERLGHIDDDTTKKIYLHVTKTRKKETARKFSELMSGSLDSFR